MTRPPHAQAVLFAVWNWLHSARVSHNSGSALLRIACFVGLVAGGLLLSTAPLHGQSAWDAPEPSSNPWQIDRSEANQNEREAEDDPWGTNDPWGTEDAWGPDNPWNEDEAYRDGNSDWARDFYDFDEENSGGNDNGSARRVRDGVAMAASACGSSCDTGGNEVCCLGNGSSGPKCRSANKGCPGNSGIDESECGNLSPNDRGAENCLSQCEIDPTADGCQDFCQANPDACRNEGIPVPLPGFIYLLLVGLSYGVYKLT